VVATLFVLDLTTGESTQIGDENVQAWDQFTPDGSSLLYSSGPVVRTVPVDGGKSTPRRRPRPGEKVRPQEADRYWHDDLGRARTNP
jgi:hypothetical protein